jgi:arylsulfatase A
MNMMNHKFMAMTVIMMLTTTLIVSSGINSPEDKRPNIVILLMDDVGYGDIGCYGHPIIKTPHMDKLAGDGIRFTSFVTGSGCTPSRTQLITGRYMPRVNFGGTLDPFPGGTGEGGIPGNEITLAEGLKKAGYKTGMAGKWHLGYQPGYLPVSKGFDEWFGLPYSNDFMQPWVDTDVPLQLYRNYEVVEYPVIQETLTARYTQEAVSFIEKNSKSDQPFFYYLAYNMAHLPIFTTDKFKGKSKAGLYGDVMEELDWSVGQVIQALKDNGKEENTIVFLASDNGPWMDPPERMKAGGVKPWHQGTAGLLRGSKGSMYEGGGRVPAVISWPGQISAGQVTDNLVAMPDIYLTFMKTGDANLPNLPLDGYNIMPFLKGETSKSPRNEYAYIAGGTLRAMRSGDWKLLLSGKGVAELFNLQLDPSERYNRINEQPEIARTIYKRMKEFAGELKIDVDDLKI